MRHMLGSDNRVVRWAMALVVLGFVVWESTLGRNDWDIFLAASRALFDGADVYQVTFFDGYHYYYSVFFATLLYPFTLLPAALGKFIWLSLNVLAVVRIFQLLLANYDFQKITPTQSRWLLLIAVFGSMRFLKSNLHLGQTTILLLLLALEALRREEKKQTMGAGFFLSLAINIKLLPAVFLPYWLYRGKFKPLFLTLTFCFVWWLLPTVWLGWERNSLLLHSYVELINPQQQRHILDIEETSFHGLSTLFSTLFSAQAQEHNGLGWRRNIADCSIETIGVFILAARVILVVFTLYFLRTMPFQSARSSLYRAWETSYLLLVIPLIAPHQQHYAFLFALPAILYVTYFFMSSRAQGFGIKGVVFTVVLLSFNLALWLGVYNAVYNHYKILTYGALILVVLLAILNPREENKKVGTSPTFHK